jgi:hypothetical protein
MNSAGPPRECVVIDLSGPTPCYISCASVPDYANAPKALAYCWTFDIGKAYRFLGMNGAEKFALHARAQGFSARTFRFEPEGERSKP